MEKKTTTKRTALKTKLSGVKGGKNNINKGDIVEFTAKKSKVTQVDTKKVIDAFIDTVKEVTDGGGYITLSGFGVFKMTKRKAYSKKASPKQKKIFGKDIIKIPASSKLSFTASKN